MAIPGKNADLIRRFKLYGFGLLLGTLIVSFVYKGKGCQLPGSAKMEELNWQQLEYTDKGTCFATCNEIADSVIKGVLIRGKVNYDKSDVHADPYPTYAIEGSIEGGKNIRMIIVDVDTVSKLQEVHYFNIETFELIADDCDCN